VTGGVVMNKVEALLKKHGPMISGDLARLYEKEYGVSNEAARQAISRSKSPVKRLYKIKFDKNQVFCYLEEQFMGEKYVEFYPDENSTRKLVISLLYQPKK
jgi:hypothetical protein